MIRFEELSTLYCCNAISKSSLIDSCWVHPI